MQLNKTLPKQQFSNRLIINWLALLLLFSATTTILAQNTLPNIQFSNISRSEGLPNNNINDILTDKYGFVWFATSDGLCKYNSSGKFQIYKAENDTISDGLRSSLILCLYADNEDNIWVGTRYGGLSRFHIPTEKWKTFVHDSTDITSLSNNEVLCITEDKKGNIYVGTENGLNIYKRESESFVRHQYDIDNPKSISARAILGIEVDNNGWVWAGTWSGGLNLMIEDPNGDESKNHFRRFNPSESQYSQNIWKVFQDNKNRYWLGTNMGGLYVMDLPDKASNFEGLQDWEPSFFNYTNKIDDPCSVNHDIIIDIHQDKRDRIWLATANGISHIEPHEIPSKVTYRYSDTLPTIKFYRHVPKHNSSTSLAADYVIDIMEDNQGTLWFGSHGGVSKFSWLNNQFDVRTIFSEEDAFPNCQNMYVDPDSKVWLAAKDKGLIIYDQKTNTYETFDDLKPSHNYISALYSQDDISLYMATNAGIAVTNLITGDIHYFAAPEWLKVEFTNFTFGNILLDRKNRLWIATESGLFILDENNGEYDYFAHDPQDPQSLSDHSVTDIIEDYKGNIWVSSYKGLNKHSYMSLDSIVFKRFYKGEGEHDLPNHRIVHMLEYDKKLYLGTTNGMVVMDIETEQFKTVTSVEKYSIQAMLVDDNGVIWGSTTEGIFRYDTKTDIFHLNEKEDGLESVAFRQNSKYIDRSGHFYFGNKTGYIKLDPNKITTNKVIPDVFITDIKSISPRGTEVFSGMHNDDIFLKHDNYSISFNYVTSNYYRPEKNGYAYKLEGFDEDWIYPESNIPAVYTNLDHGRYTFKVKASNNNGYWNEEGVSKSFIIRPAMWETWWFKFISSLFAGILIYIGLHRYTKNISVRNKELKDYNDKLNKEIEERNKIELELQTTNEELTRSNSELEQFAYIASHDLQEPLRITGSFIDLLAAKYGDVLDDNAFKYIDFAKGGVGRMGLLIKNLLTFSKVGGTVLDFQSVNLKQVVEEKLLDLSRLIKSKNVTIDLGVLPEIRCEKNQISMLFYNLINNAIKFNENPKPVVTISAQNSFDPSFYSFYISDNGIGIDPQHQDKIFEIFKRLHDKDAYEGTGIGLALCKKIIERHGGKIWLESKPNRGTTFYFTISKDLTNFNKPQKQEELATKSIA